MLKELIESLKSDFKLTYKGSLETFLRVNFSKTNYNTLELNQLYLIQRILDALSLNDDAKCHDTPSNCTLHKDNDGKKRIQK